MSKREFPSNQDANNERPRILLYTVIALLVGGAVGGIVHARRTESNVTRSARAFLTSLTPEAKKKAQYSFDSEERFNWHFVPKERNGLSFKEMTPAQREAAITLLRSGVSKEGIQRLETVRQLEDVLHEIEKGSGPVRDPDLYFVTIFGEPSDRGLWGWRYEGHHVSLQWTVKDGRVLADTPQFLGANPAEVRNGPMKGTRLLSQEEDLAFALLRSLDENQRKEAILMPEAPSDILTGNQRKAAIQEDRGVAFSSLTKDQKKALTTLIARHCALQSGDIAARRMSALRKAGLDAVKFAWMGGAEPGKGHYYRIQGKTFLIEFDNTQNNANHIHTVWRDFNGDFGADLLAEHYQQGR